MNRLYCLLLVLLMLLIATPALARRDQADKPVPDLTGVWKGTTESVAMGTLRHTEASPAPKFLKMDFTITIDKQEGARFHGTKASATAKETLLGVVENSQVYMVDDDGMMIGKLLGKNKMSVKYLHVNANGRVASITLFTREEKPAPAAQ